MIIDHLILNVHVRIAIAIVYYTIVCMIRGALLRVQRHHRISKYMLGWQIIRYERHNTEIHTILLHGWSIHVVVWSNLPGVLWRIIIRITIT